MFVFTLIVLIIDISGGTIPQISNDCVLLRELTENAKFCMNNYAHNNQ